MELGHEHAAVDVEGLSCGIVCGFGGEVEGGCGDVLGVSDGALGDLGEDLLVLLGGEFLGHGGIDEAGGDKVCGDVAGGEFEGDGFGEALEGCFCADIVSLSFIS